MRWRIPEPGEAPLPPLWFLVGGVGILVFVLSQWSSIGWWPL